MPVGISLFAGCGGCSLGLKYAGVDTRLAVDINADACRTYATNLHCAHVWQADLAEVSAAAILAKAGMKGGDVDIITGGPPCQGFSSAGARDWGDPRNRLVRSFVEIVTDIRPTWFVMENVEGLLTANHGFYLIEAIARFLRTGYWVRAEKVYMEEYGIPQRRKRVIIVGNLANVPFAFPATSHMAAESLFLPPARSIMDAIGDLPPAVDTGVAHYVATPRCGYQRAMRRGNTGSLTCHESKAVNGATQRRIECLEPGGTMRDLPVELQHDSFRRRAFRRVMDGTPTEKRGGAPSGIKRLLAASPSLTITSASAAEFVHPFENRPLTLRECARIQSLPDWFQFTGGWSSIATQIGNAVPPLFMARLARHIGKYASWERVAEPRGRWLGIDATKSSGMSPLLRQVLQDLEERTRDFARTIA